MRQVVQGLCFEASLPKLIPPKIMPQCLSENVPTVDVIICGGVCLTNSTSLRVGC